MSAAIRQYDIWIDGRKLSPNFLLDEETQPGLRVLLAFDGRVSLLDPNTFTPLKRTQPRRNYAKLDGDAIEFQLQHDGSHKRACIASVSSYLIWTHHRVDGTLPPFVNFPNHPEGIQEQLVFGRTYVFADTSIVWSSDSDCFINGVPRRPQMTLRVTDPLAGLEVGDGRPPTPVLHPPERGYSPGHTLRVLLSRLKTVRGL